MNPNDLWAIIAILVCTLCNFFSLCRDRPGFGAQQSSAAVQATGRAEEARERSVEVIKLLLKEPTRVVAAVQLGLTVLSLTAAAIAASVLAPDLADCSENGKFRTRSGYP